MWDSSTTALLGHDAAPQCCSEPNYRAVLQAEGQPAFAAVLDQAVKGNVLQVLEIFTRPPGRRSRRPRLRGAQTTQ
jgi:hypothetical protein